MSRRSTSQVRDDTPRRFSGERPGRVPGLTPRGEAAINLLERTRLRPGEVRQALDTLTRLVRDPQRQLFVEEYGCGEPECCPDLVQVRAFLEAVAHALPLKDARRFRRRLAELDEGR